MKSFASVFAFALFVLGANAQEKTPMVFMAKDAKITAVGQIRFENGSDQQNVGVWGSTNAAVSWTAATLAKGTYRVIVIYACDRGNAGGEFEVTVGSQRASFVICDTGGWKNFKEADLGPVIIRKAESAEITGRVTRKPRGFGINVRAVKLVPEP